MKRVNAFVNTLRMNIGEQELFADREGAQGESARAFIADAREQIAKAEEEKAEALREIERKREQIEALRRETGEGMEQETGEEKHIISDVKAICYKF